MTGKTERLCCPRAISAASRPEELCMVNGNELVEWLREMDRRHGNEALPVVRVAIDEPLFNWMSLGACSDCGCPGLDVGQDHDCRYTTNGKDGLHGQVFTSAGYVEFHLDRADACRDLAAHGAEDTRMVEGALGGALLGALIGGLLGGDKGIATGAAFGALGGGVVGANTPRAARKVYEFRSVLGLPAGAWEFRAA